jgi:hypothetical protein
MEEKILKLTIKKKWFDLINNNIKTEEYREIKDYWISRICDVVEPYKYNIRKFDVVEFKNGYKSSAPKSTFKILDITVGKGNPEWGAEIDEDYFVIKLGERVD